MLFGDLQSIFQLGLATYLVSDWFELTSSARVWSAVERKLHNDFSSRESRIENLLGHRFLKDKLDINNRLKQEERIIEWAIHPVGADIEEDMDDWHQLGKVLALVLLLASSFFAATSIWLLAGFLLVGIAAIPLIAIKAGYWLRYDFLRFNLACEIDGLIQCYEQAIIQAGGSPEDGHFSSLSVDKDEVIRLADQNIQFHRGTPSAVRSQAAINAYYILGMFVRFPMMVRDTLGWKK